MNATELSRSVAAGKLPPLIFLYGEEAFLLQEALTEVCNAAVAPADRDFNLDQFSAQDDSVDEVLEAAYSYPVFAPRRCVIVRQAQAFNAAQYEQLLQYVKKPLDSTCLVLCAEKIDKRKKFFTTFKKHGELVEFKRLYPDKIPFFVERRAAERGKRFTADGLNLFCHRVGTNLTEVIAELDKLVSYCGTDESILDVADVAAVVSDTCLDSIFDLTDAVGSGALSKALLLTERLQQDGEHPLMILAMLVRHFRQLWKVQALLESGAAQPEICKRVGINPYFAGKTIAQARKFDTAAFVAIFELFVELDMDLKSGGGQASSLMQQGIMRLVAFGDAVKGHY
ncbi:MAG: DNA polymerase III subunit delta [Desulfuromonadaceae bacterium]|nr:DNA polymerase III subunit delta [Desulfuromonas sp.]MDY0184661.1 DNA polymerase III subunit delta [Desulfuromonadaceae bacterium]